LCLIFKKSLALLDSLLGLGGDCVHLEVDEDEEGLDEDVGNKDVEY
jgi:hypothetical protein